MFSSLDLRSPASFAASTSTDVNVTLSMHYTLPPTTISSTDALAVFKSHAWVTGVMRKAVWRLQSSNCTKREIVANMAPCDDDKDTSACVICLAEMLACGVVLDCGHRFHRDCITPWLARENTCPTCRHAFELEYAGKYVFKLVETRVAIPPGAALTALAGQDVLLVVSVCLAPRTDDTDDATSSCEIRSSIVALPERHVQEPSSAP
ncbi:Aste57867_16565 [Aphanomyces stellatus]|uniref:Aste57867_16565 protein n=1 Tax=Aphanomyces stellatus TaxID=120398 RepID=A0A485L6Q7_9STRA|nr:hypothetical protein As57867_016508 [Aphanomyces stellatus]VFT93338.1 Aste57867_16565 [Aphanomyces stellatus]